MSTPHSAHPPAAHPPAGDATGRDAPAGVPRSLEQLRSGLSGLTLVDEHRLARRMDRAESKGTLPAQQSAIADEFDAALQRVEDRRQTVPELRFPSELPVSQRAEDIAAAIAAHQVVIVAGETGSGKTTQLPKICLQLGRGVRGQIGHTQPRRIAARSVAERIAEETDTEVGAAVGYQMRFTDRSDASTLVKVMTDGILLSEMGRDRMLRNYDTLIIDEAHERSLNIDFILGYLKQLLPKRPDLKVIITSATIEPERFARHFGDERGPAPIVEVSGRTYPVEVRYRPLSDPESEEDDSEQVEAIGAAVDELCAADRSRSGIGDILVFCSGEREIRDAADHLQRTAGPDTEVLPLYSRLSAAEQHRVFASHSGRRIVLATNVAETSLTVPGIRYVIDPGTARISRYSHRTKVQRLPIERISQASANQRKGRCGRESEGICIRLYSQADFESRQAYTDPEILRTNLASVILQMAALRLGQVAAFGFLDPPEQRSINDGVALLSELGALRETGSRHGAKLTEVGRSLAQLPIDPRLGRMVIEAAEYGCVREVMIIAAALSIQDPRERPAEHRQEADASHARFRVPGSDFMAYLSLWEYLRTQQKALSSNQFRKLCRSEYLNHLRVREWQDIVGQLRQLAKPLGIHARAGTGSGAEESAPNPEAIHMALLSGLLSHIGVRDGDRKDYLGARGARFAIFPGSAQFSRPPRWVVAAELVETSRLWGRVVASIEPEWAEKLAGTLVKRTYSEPHWERKQAAVMAYERVTLYGVPLVADRKIHYGRIDPETSRDLFIRHALVEGDWQTGHSFFHSNRQLVDDVSELENRARRRDILVDEQTLFEFYDQRVGTEVVSGAHFDSWWKAQRRHHPDLLDFDTELLINDQAGAVDQRSYPDTWTTGGLTLPLNYHFDPGESSDGVTVDVPLAALNQLRGQDFAWNVPGLRSELITALLKSLPKSLRRNFVPATDVAAALSARISPDQGELLPALERELHALTGVEVPRSAWSTEALPAHLRLNFRVHDTEGTTLAEGEDLDRLRTELAPRLRQALASAGQHLERTGMQQWEIGELPQLIAPEQDGIAAKGYPALVDAGQSVSVRIFDSPAQQRQAMWLGSRRLLLLQLPAPAKHITRSLGNAAKLTLNHNPHGSIRGLLQDATNCAVDRLMAAAGGPAWDADGFARLLEAVRPQLPHTALQIVTTAEQILLRAHEVDQEIRSISARGSAESLSEARKHLETLVYPDFLTATGWRRLPHLPRYLQAAHRRLQALPAQPERDLEHIHLLQELEAQRQQLRGRASAAQLANIRWMLEELRVSFFAQQLGTPHPISEKRVRNAMIELAAPAAG